MNGELNLQVQQVRALLGVEADVLAIEDSYIVITPPQHRRGRATSALAVAAALDEDALSFWRLSANWDRALALAVLARSLWEHGTLARSASYRRESLDSLGAHVPVSEDDRRSGLELSTLLLSTDVGAGAGASEIERVCALAVQRPTAAVRLSALQITSAVARSLLLTTGRSRLALIEERLALATAYATSSAITWSGERLMVADSSPPL